MEIKQLKLYSKDINEQLHFYHHIIGLDLLKADENRTQLQAGSTKLIFQNSVKTFLYHYCFLIPNGTLEEAMTFLREKDIDPISYNGSEIVRFPTGRSIYFYDPDGNIAEFIERPSLANESAEPFNANSILKVNEIGLPHDNPLGISNKIIQEFDIQLSQPEIMREDFCWVGDYNGVFIVPEIGRYWIPTEHSAMVNDFEIEFVSRGNIYLINVEDNQLTPITTLTP